MSATWLVESFVKMNAILCEKRRFGSSLAWWGSQVFLVITEVSRPSPPFLVLQHAASLRTTCVSLFILVCVATCWACWMMLDNETCSNISFVLQSAKHCSNVMYRFVLNCMAQFSVELYTNSQKWNFIVRRTCLADFYSNKSFSFFITLFGNRNWDINQDTYCKLVNLFEEKASVFASRMKHSSTFPSMSNKV